MHSPDERHPERSHEQILDRAQQPSGAETQHACVDVHVDPVVARRSARRDESGGLAVASAVSRQFPAERPVAERAPETVADERICFPRRSAR